MNIVALLKPNNEMIIGDYSLIKEECIKECSKQENIEKFIEFKQDYNFFEPYFDFVMFHLHYIFINPFYQKKTALYAKENSDELYIGKIESLDYETIKNKILEETKEPTTIPYMVKSSDKQLRIEKKDAANMTTCLLNSSNIGFLNKEGGKDGSHGITGNTILNQLLLSTPTIEKTYKNTLADYDENTNLNFLVIYLGFLRITDKTTYPLIIGNEDSISKETKDLINRLKGEGYQYFDLEEINEDNIIEKQDSNRKEM